MIVKTGCGTDGSFYSITPDWRRHLASVSQSALHWSWPAWPRWPPTPVVDPLANVGSCHNGKCNQEPARLNQAKVLNFYLQKIKCIYVYLFTYLSLMFGCTRVGSGPARCPGPWGLQETVSSVLVKPGRGRVVGSRSAGGHTRLGHPGSPQSPFSGLALTHIHWPPPTAPRHQHPHPARTLI